MRIWFAASVPQNSTGGVNRSIRTLSDGLKQAGHRTKLIYANSPRQQNYLFFALKTAGLLLLHIFNSPDLIIGRSTDGVVCALLVKLFRLKTKIVLFNHGWEEKVFQVERRLPSSIVTSSTTWKARLIRFPLLRLSLSLSKYCICGTIEEARWISRKYPYAKKKLRVVPNGIEIPVSPFWPSQEYLPPSFLMIGGFTWKKNLEYGIGLFRRIVEKLPEARLFLVGTGAVPLSKQSIIEPLGDSIFIVNRESPEKMDRWYETCPYLLSTSRYEGGRSFAILEAQGKGLVVFATEIPSSREIISDTHNGVLLTGIDYTYDLQKIITICEDAEMSRRIGKSAWGKASRHNLSRQVKRLERATGICDF